MIFNFYLFIILFIALHLASLLTANSGHIILSIITCLTLIIFSYNKKYRILITWFLISFIYGISFFAKNDSKILEKLNDVTFSLSGEIINNPSLSFHQLNFQLKASQYQIPALNQKYLINASDIFYVQAKNCDAKQLRQGDIVECEGVIKKLNGQKLFDKYLKNKGVRAKFITRQAQITNLAYAKKNLISYYLSKLKSGLAHSIQNTSIESQYKALILAVLFGEKRKLDHDIKQLFIKLNILHIFAISGLHFGILGIIIQNLISLTGIDKKTNNIISIICLFFFLAMINFPASAFRAWIMLSLYWLAPCLGRQSTPLNIVSVSGIILLLINPRYTLDPGFILSYVAVLSIFIPGTKMHNFLSLKITHIKDHYKMDKQFLKRINFTNKWILSPIIYSFNIWIWTAPLIAYYFKIFSPVSVLTNYFAVFFLTLFLSLSLIAAFGGLFFTIVAEAYAQIIQIILIIFLKILGIIESFKFSYIELPDFNIKMLGISYLILFSAYFLLSFISYVNQQNSKLINDN